MFNQCLNTCYPDKTKYTFSCRKKHNGPLSYDVMIIVNVSHTRQVPTLVSSTRRVKHKEIIHSLCFFDSRAFPDSLEHYTASWGFEVNRRFVENKGQGGERDLPETPSIYLSPRTIRPLRKDRSKDMVNKRPNIPLSSCKTLGNTV